MTPRKRRWILFLLALVAGWLLLESAAMACPTCKENLGQNDPARANLVRGYFWSIVFMMSMPFLILGGLGALLWREVRKAKRAQAQQGESEKAPPENSRPTEAFSSEAQHEMAEV